jgi:thiol-disulfide isomerase/thioredoxin
VIEAVEKALKAKPTSEQETTLLKTKLEAYQVLIMVGVPDVMPKALKFAATLKADKRPGLAELGEAAWLDFRMSTLPTADEKERRAIIEALAAALAKKPQTYLEFVMHVGRMLEMLGDGPTAAFAYETFGDVLSKNLDENIQKLGEKLKTGAVRRAKLLSGEPLKISGTTLDGKPFDISAYKGKVVVVDFWATWCGPCLAELPNLKAVYDKYHGRGLEVVGVNVDDDQEELAKFLKENPLPWKTLVNSKGEKKGLSGGPADYYGISAIPAVFLMSRDGKVVSLAARGEQLGELVSKLMDEKARSTD